MCCCANRHNLREEHLLDLASSLDNITVLVAGKPRRGKSTALNNLFGVNFAARTEATSVTSIVVELDSQQDGIKVRSIDSPGLTANDVDTDKALNDMTKKVESSKRFTLLYFVSAMDTIDNSDNIIIEKLTSEFTSNIWKRCVLVLSFCDKVRNENFKTKSTDEAYKTHLKRYVSQFRDVLEKYVSEVPPIRLSFDCKVGEMSPNTIVVVPVAETREAGRKPSIIPGIKMDRNTGWPEYAFRQIVWKSSQECEGEGGEGVAVVVGATVGAAIGATVAGPLGAVVGALVGLISAHLKGN